MRKVHVKIAKGETLLYDGKYLTNAHWILDKNYITVPAWAAGLMRRGSFHKPEFQAANFPIENRFRHLYKRGYDQIRPDAAPEGVIMTDLVDDFSGVRARQLKGVESGQNIWINDKYRFIFDFGVEVFVDKNASRFYQRILAIDHRIGFLAPLGRE